VCPDNGSPVNGSPVIGNGVYVDQEESQECVIWKRKCLEPHLKF